MAKYIPLPSKKINRNKGTKMKEIWAKIKCFFGYCDEIDEIEMRQKLAVDRTYKVEPKVMVVKTKEVKTPTVVISKKDKKIQEAKLEVKVEEVVKAKKDSEKHQHSATLKNAKKVQEVVKSVKETKETKKVKRHWYNNTKTQKLIPEGEETKLPKTWKKGRLPKVSKGDK